MRIVPALIATLLLLSGVLHGDEPKPDNSSTGKFFERLDTNADGKVTLKEAPEQGKMLVEFLLSQLGKKNSDNLEQADFLRLTHRHTDEWSHGRAVVVALGTGDVQLAPDNCPACAMGLTAEFVFKRLDVDEDKFVTAIEFMRSPGMDDEKKAREVVGRLDKSGDGKLSWDELEAAYKARHANCKKPDSATLDIKQLAKVKHVLLLPVNFNDGSRVPQEVLNQIFADLYVLAGGYYIAGEGDGAYRMQNGAKQEDRLIAVWIAVGEDDIPELKTLVGKIGTKLDQKEMYLERTGGLVEFIPSVR